MSVHDHFDHNKTAFCVYFKRETRRPTLHEVVQWCDTDASCDSTWLDFINYLFHIKLRVLMCSTESADVVIGASSRFTFRFHLNYLSWNIQNGKISWEMPRYDLTSKIEYPDLRFALLSSVSPIKFRDSNLCCSGYHAYFTFQSFRVLILSPEVGQPEMFNRFPRPRKQLMG